MSTWALAPHGTARTGQGTGIDLVIAEVGILREIELRMMSASSLSVNSLIVLGMCLAQEARVPWFPLSRRWSRSAQ